MAKEEKKNKGGRPKEDIAVKYSIDFKRLEKIAAYGATDVFLADLYGVGASTISDWRKNDERFSDALKRGKEKADKAVVKSLYKRALGYAYNETTHEQLKIGDSETPKVKVKVVRKQIHPDTTACIFWLKNRDQQNWRDVKDHNVKGSLGHSFSDGMKKVRESIKGNPDLEKKFSDELKD